MAIASSSLLLLLLMFLAFLDHGAAAVTNLSSIEAAVRDRAFQLFRRTSEIVVVDVPAVLAGAGVEASATRVRSNALWADGVNATAAGFAVAVPPRVVPAPFARRVAIVFVRFLGNSSSWLFAAPPGYALAAPVVALLAFDASGPNGDVALRALGAPVRVEFRDISPSNGFNATTARCLTFSSSGGKAVAAHAVAMEPGPSCMVSGTGHYGVAVRVETPPPPPPVRERWWVWKVGATAGGVAAASFLAVTVVGAVRWRRRRRREEMEWRAMCGEELGRMAVRGSRMPSAKMVRTQPEVEEGSPPPWRRS
uniref:Legume lectin domain-containing protein n=1 Tax=Oryza punctata TaxID=4537 RepID=A0A0E0L855_ORYPU|nr:hypothetical protein [Oryza punctata]